nr:MAG TPA: Portal [Caudoviricetes sp.]
MTRRRKYKKSRAEPAAVTNSTAVKTTDAFQNPLTRSGAFMPNVLESTMYPLTRLSRNWQLLNSLYRSHWVIRRIIDVIPSDMLKNGYKILSQMPPDQLKKVTQLERQTKLTLKIKEGLRWGRLYGGAAGVILLDGHDDILDKPLDYDMVMPGSFKGLLIVDRWSGISPDEELVTDISDPEFGLPDYYTITAEGMERGIRVHHSRICRFIGRDLPYIEKLAETYWGASEIEHVYDELKKRDNVSWNMAMLTFMANLRTVKMEGMGQILGLGGEKAQEQLYNTIQAMNAMMNNNSLQIIGENDEYESHQYTFSGLGEVYDRFMMDVAGAAEIPVTKLFGRSPAGMNATGESDMQNYYDTIEERQESELRPIYDKLLPIMMLSCFGAIPDDFDFAFNPVRRPKDDEMADLASKNTDSVTKAFDSGMISQRTALKELRQQSETTGMWSNITDEDIEKADAEVSRPDEAMGALPFGDSPQQMTMDAAWEESKHPRGPDGKFGTGSASTNSSETGTIKTSPAGTNSFKVQGFRNKQKLRNHWKNGRTHQAEYPDFTMEQYEKRAVELAEMPVGGSIQGHADKDGNVIRYDADTNDFVKGNPNKGITTMFKPAEGKAYYLKQREEDLKHGGKT